MKTVKIKSKDLLAHLKKNRTKHQAEYAELMIEYRQAIIDMLSNKLKAAKKNEDIDHHIHVVRPSDYTSSYDQAIAMLEWTTDSEVELDQHEFVQFVQDQWVWKQAFMATQSAYGKGI
jgi:hypothetical protein